MDTSQLRVNPSDLQDVSCEKCGNDTFREACFVKRVPALLSPTGKDSYLPVATFACLSCGHVNEPFRPQLRQDAAPETQLVTE